MHRCAFPPSLSRGETPRPCPRFLHPRPPPIPLRCSFRPSWRPALVPLRNRKARHARRRVAPHKAHGVGEAAAVQLLRLVRSRAGRSKGQGEIGGSVLPFWVRMVSPVVRSPKTDKAPSIAIFPKRGGRRRQRARTTAGLTSQRRGALWVSPPLSRWRLPQSGSRWRFLDVKGGSTKGAGRPRRGNDAKENQPIRRPSRRTLVLSFGR